MLFCARLVDIAIMADQSIFVVNLITSPAITKYRYENRRRILRRFRYLSSPSLA